MTREVCPHCATTKTARWQNHNGIMYCHRCALSLNQRGYLPDLGEELINMVRADDDPPPDEHLQDDQPLEPPLSRPISGGSDAGERAGEGSGVRERAASGWRPRNEEDSAMARSADCDGTIVFGSSPGVALERNGGRWTVAAHREGDVVSDRGKKRRGVAGFMLCDGREIDPLFDDAGPSQNSAQRFGRISMANIARQVQAAHFENEPSGGNSSYGDAALPPRFSSSHLSDSLRQPANPVLQRPERTLGRRWDFTVEQSQAQRSLLERESLHQEQEMFRSSARGVVTPRRMESERRSAKRFHLNGRQIAASMIDSPPLVSPKGGKLTMHPYSIEDGRPQGTALCPEEVVHAVRACTSFSDGRGHFSGDGRRPSEGEAGNGKSGHVVGGIEVDVHRDATGVEDVGVHDHAQGVRKFAHEERGRTGDTESHPAHERSAFKSTISRCVPPFFVTDNDIVPSRTTILSTRMTKSPSPDTASRNERHWRKSDRGDVETMLAPDKSGQVSLMEAVGNRDGNEDNEQDDSIALNAARRIADQRAKSMVRCGPSHMREHEEEAKMSNDRSSVTVTAIEPVNAKLETGNIRDVICNEIARGRRNSNEGGDGGKHDAAVVKLLGDKDAICIERLHKLDIKTMNNSIEEDEEMKGYEADIDEEADEICKVVEDDSGEPQRRVARRERFRGNIEQLN